jgi:hypothetical protein
MFLVTFGSPQICERAKVLKVRSQDVFREGTVNTIIIADANLKEPDLRPCRVQLLVQKQLLLVYRWLCS